MINSLGVEADVIGKIMAKRLSQIIYDISKATILFYSKDNL